MWMRVEHFLCNESSVKVRVDLSTPCAAHARACLTFFLFPSKIPEESGGGRKKRRAQWERRSERKMVKNAAAPLSRRGSELGSGQRGWDGQKAPAAAAANEQRERASSGNISERTDMRRPLARRSSLPPRAADESMEEKVHDGSKIRRSCPSIRKCLSVGLLSPSRNSIYSVCFKGPDL